MSFIKTRQFAHQRKWFEICKDKKFFAVLWEMGLGKSKFLLDIAGYLYTMGLIDQVLIVAPNSVYRNWLLDEIPKHLGVPHNAWGFPKNHLDARHRALRMLWLNPQLSSDKLRVMAMAIDSLCTDHGFEFAMQAVTMFRTLIIVDESTIIKSHSAKRTKRVKKVGERCHYRYILTGTPAAQSPFDLHSQFQFLDPDFWTPHGVRTFGSFKAEFGVTRRTWVKGKNGPVQRDLVSGYRRLDELHEIIKPVSSRLLKEDSGIELPPKLYSKYRFEMHPEQRQAYEELRSEFALELAGGEYVEAPMALTRLLRLQQITSGFVGAADSYEAMFEDESIKPRDIIPPSRNPRLLLLQEVLEKCSHKVIVWCRFTREVEMICQNIPNTIRHDGKMSQRARGAALDQFKDPEDTEANVLVVNQKAMAYGKTVTIAKTVIYYSNDFSLERRLQSEDRVHRIGQDQRVLIIDFMAENTVDEDVVDSLRNKFDIAAETTGDRIRQWITRSNE